MSNGEQTFYGPLTLYNMYNHHTKLFYKSEIGYTIDIHTKDYIEKKNY